MRTGDGGTDTIESVTLLVLSRLAGDGGRDAGRSDTALCCGGAFKGTSALLVSRSSADAVLDVESF